MTFKITKTLDEAQMLTIIESVTAAERITKDGLSQLSRAMLAYAYDGGDITLVNTLMGVDETTGKFRLTPINWRVAAQYFNSFLAYTSNYEKEVSAFAVKGEGKRVPLVFNKKSKKKYETLLPKVTAWLEDDTNDLWSWSADIKLEVKEPDYLMGVVQALAKALDEEKGAFEIADILAVIAENTDIGRKEMMSYALGVDEEVEVEAEIADTELEVAVDEVLAA